MSQQEQAPTEQAPSVADRSTEFVAVEGGQETSSAAGLLTTAYIGMWLCVFVFIWFTSRRQSQLTARLIELEAGLKRADEGASPRS